MSVLVFDTHRYVRQLHDAGFSEAQAEILTRLQQDTVDATLEQIHNRELATKQDLREAELGLSLRNDLRETGLKLELKIAETKSELIRWIVGAGFLQTALITALLLKMSSVL